MSLAFFLLSILINRFPFPFPSSTLQLYFAFSHSLVPSVTYLLFFPLAVCLSLYQVLRTFIDIDLRSAALICFHSRTINTLPLTHMLANLFIVATLLLSPTLVTAAERKLLRSPRNHLSHPANGMVKRARGGQNHGGNGGWGRGPHGNWTGGRSSNASSTTSADQESSTAVAVVEVAVQATSETSTSETIAQKTKTTTSVAASETTSTSSSSGSYSGQATYFYRLSRLLHKLR